MDNDVYFDISDKKNVEDLESHLNTKAKQYLSIIYNEYAQYMNEEQLSRFAQLMNLDSIVTVESDDVKYKEKNGSDAKVPLAHGSRVFEDGKIHFYPFGKFNEHVNVKTESVLMHELFHYFVRPEYVDENNNAVQVTGEYEEIRKDTSEALVDMCARDVNMKYGINQTYKSNYANNVVFFREALNNIPDKDERMKLVFNGSVQDVFNKTTIDGYNTFNEYYSNKNKNTEFHQTIKDYAVSNAPGMEEKAEKEMLNVAANCESKDKALSTIGNMWREIKGEQVRTHDKNVVRMRVPQNQDGGNNQNSGSINPFLLSLITGFVMGIVSVLAYIFISG